MKDEQKIPQQLHVALSQMALSGSAFQRSFMEQLAQRQREPNANSTDVDDLEELGEDRLEAVAFFKSLEEIGCGKFFAGRRKHKSRIEWGPFGAIAIAKAYLTDPTDLAGVEGTLEHNDIVPDTDESNAPEFYDHSFLLRPQIKTTVRLPLDLTSEEANRLAEFIRSLPF